MTHFALLFILLFAFGLFINEDRESGWFTLIIGVFAVAGIGYGILCGEVEVRSEKELLVPQAIVRNDTIVALLYEDKAVTSDLHVDYIAPDDNLLICKTAKFNSYNINTTDEYSVVVNDD